jgi:inorganic pyrophosphatase
MRMLMRGRAPAALRKQTWGCAAFARKFSSWSVDVEGEKDTMAFRVFFKNQSGDRISPWHDIPLRNTDVPDSFNFINEIPVGERAKMEVCLDEASNPIKQDTKKGKLRYFGYGDIPFNYGCLPQTWENPNEPHPETHFNGDNDPIDVCELSGKPIAVGEVTPVKVLGVLAMIDEEETDWKVLAIRSDHALADSLNDEADLDKHFPGVVDGVREWFRMYKTADGKPENTFAFEGQLLPQSKAVQIVDETHQEWKDLRAGKAEKGDIWLN